MRIYYTWSSTQWPGGEGRPPKIFRNKLTISREVFWAWKLARKLMYIIGSKDLTLKPISQNWDGGKNEFPVFLFLRSCFPNVSLRILLHFRIIAFAYVFCFFFSKLICQSGCVNIVGVGVFFCGGLAVGGLCYYIKNYI